MNLNIKQNNDDNKFTQLNISDEIFNKEYKEGLVHQVLTSYMLKSRQGSKAQKSRSDVSGGGAKPWRQKGTGRARAGTIRSPIFRKGGVTFAAKPKVYTKKINKKVYRSAICMIFSKLLKENNILFLENIEINTHKTKDFCSFLSKIEIPKGLFIISPKEFSKNLYFSSRNIRDISVCLSKKINPVNLLSFDKFIITKTAIKEIENLIL